MTADDLQTKEETENLSESSPQNTAVWGLFEKSEKLSLSEETPTAPVQWGVCLVPECN